MTNPAAENEFRSRVVKLEGLLHDLENAGDPVVREKALEAVQTLMEFHGAGIARIVELIAKTGTAGEQLLTDLAGDELVSSLLLLYGLHPSDFDSRVRQAIDKARPAIRQHGGTLELISITDGAVKVQVERSGHGCGSTAGKMKAAIEEAIFNLAPEVTAIEIEGLTPPSASNGFVPVEQLLGGRLKVKQGECHDPEKAPAAGACAGHA